MELDEAKSIVLAKLAQADEHLRREEVEAGQRILDRAAKADTPDHWITALTRTAEFDSAVSRLSTEPEATRALIIADLWELAISDFEVARRENDLIYAIAALLGVPAYPKGARPLPVKD